MRTQFYFNELALRYEGTNVDTAIIIIIIIVTNLPINYNNNNNKFKSLKTISNSMVLNVIFTVAILIHNLEAIRPNLL